MPTLVSYTTNNVGGCGGEAVARSLPDVSKKGKEIVDDIIKLCDHG
jgi:hypothetical protein